MISIEVDGYHNILNIVSPSVSSAPSYPSGFDMSKFLSEKRRLVYERLKSLGVTESKFYINETLNDFSLKIDNGCCLSFYKPTDAGHHLTILSAVSAGVVDTYAILVGDDGLSLLFYRLLKNNYLDIESIYESDTDATLESKSYGLDKQNKQYFNIPISELNTAKKKQEIDSSIAVSTPVIFRRLEKYLQAMSIKARNYSFGDDLGYEMSLNIYESTDFWIVRNIKERGRQSVVGYFVALEDAIAVFVSLLINKTTIDQRKLMNSVLGRA